MTIDTLIFDMDGTMVDSLPFHAQSWVVFCERHGIQIDVHDLPEDLKEKKAVVDIKALGNQTLKEVRDEVERSYIMLKLQENDWNISRTADVLGIERTNLHKKIKAYDLHRPSGSEESLRRDRGPRAALGWFEQRIHRGFVTIAILFE